MVGRVIVNNNKRTRKEECHEKATNNLGNKRTHEEDDEFDIEDTPTLRRSTRKRSKIMENPFPTPPSTNKKKGKEKIPRESKKSKQEPHNLILTPKPPPTFLTLPDLVLKKLLLFMDVRSMENLSRTCSHFDLLINGNYLTSLSVPFDAHFMKELYQTNIIEKKPLLQLKCSKSRESFGHVFIDNYSTTESVFSDDRTIHGRKVMLMSRMSVHNVVQEDHNPDLTDYLILSQLSFIKLDKLREIDLLPEGVDGITIEPNTRYSHYKSYQQFDYTLLNHLEVNCWLTNVSRLSILIFFDIDAIYIEDFFLPEKMPNLQELEVVAASRLGASTHIFKRDYLGRLEDLVKAAKVSTLKIKVLSETKKAIPKVLRNNTIQKLIITGPCTFNAHLVMENLKEVELNLAAPMNDECCSYFKFKPDDRKLHRSGLCIVNIGSVFENCPKLEKFMGFDLTGLNKVKKSKEEFTFSRWNHRVKKIFFDDYIQQGGTKEFRQWSRTRWLTKRPVIPNEII